ncbi:hypothetical protein BH24ACT6_BH24ACT6_03180 [soil metagenome]
MPLRRYSCDGLLVNTTRSTPPSSPWLPGVAAAALMGAVVVAGIAGGWTADDGEGGPTASSDLARRGATTQRGPVATVSVDTVAPRRKSQLDDPVGFGMYGDDVTKVQRRLKKLSFDPGPIDGNFGERTRAAVWGFEKLVLGVDAAEATGVVTQRVWSRMQDRIVVEPRRPESTDSHTEIYLPEQMVIFFRRDEPVLISHMSSGDNAEWCDDVVISPGEYGNAEGTEPLRRRECGVSITPGGVFNFERKVEGLRQSALGGLWNPIYFNYGIAIHGAMTVPLEPASHGCVRVPIETSERFQDILRLGDQVFVFDGVKEPEEYGAQLPVFNKIDPEWLATSTTSTLPPTTTTSMPPTTTPPTTAPPTTAPPATTLPPPLPPPAPPTPAPPTTTTTPVVPSTAPMPSPPPATGVDTAPTR